MPRGAKSAASSKKLWRMDDEVYVTVDTFLMGYTSSVNLPKAIEEYYVSGKVVNVYSDKATVYFDKVVQYHVVDKAWWETSRLSKADVLGKINLDLQTYKSSIVKVNRGKKLMENETLEDDTDIDAALRLSREEKEVDSSLNRLGIPTENLHKSLEEKKQIIFEKKSVIKRKQLMQASKKRKLHSCEGEKSNNNYCRKKEFIEKTNLRLEISDGMEKFKHVVVPFPNGSKRCVYPECATRTTKPKYQCFQCKIPLCITTTGLNKLDSCFFLYHTVKELEVAANLGKELITSV